MTKTAVAYNPKPIKGVKMKSSTAQMNDRKRESGLRSTQQWIVDVRGTELEAEFNIKHKALRDDIARLSARYEEKLKHCMVKPTKGDEA